MATGAMPPQVARQLGRHPRGATRSHGWMIFGGIVFVLVATLVLGYVLFKSQSRGAQEALKTYATKTMASAIDGGYKEPIKVESKPTAAPIDTSAAEERRKMLAALEEMQRRLEALEKRKGQTTATKTAAEKPLEKRPAPMLYLNKEMQDKVPAVPVDHRPLYTLAPWATHLPCVIQPLMNSDVPGMFTAKVTANVRDTQTGQHILVPQGATIGGQDRGQDLLYGNQRLPVMALALTIGNQTYELAQPFPVTDQLGTNGLTGDVDSHFWRLFGAVLIGGALRGGQQMLQMEMAQAAGAGQVATGIAGVGNQALQPRIGRALDARPTIRIWPGQVCNVLLTKELKLPALYE